MTHDHDIGFCPLASGSKGNCLYLGTPQCKVLIDAGISTKAIKSRLQQINVDIDSIQAVIITHDHGDHIGGLEVLARKMGIPVFANTETAKGIVNNFRNCPKFKIFSTGEPFSYRDLSIHPFSVPHDAVDPVAFIIYLDGLKLGVCADLGFATKLVETQLQKCDYLYLEANHKPSMVHAHPSPYYRQRVLSRHGHLSNDDCAELLSKIAHDGLKHTHLAHLSSQCNTPEIALNTVSEYLKKKGIKLNLSIAHQEKVSEMVIF